MGMKKVISKFDDGNDFIGDQSNCNHNHHIHHPGDHDHDHDCHDHHPGDNDHDHDDHHTLHDWEGGVGVITQTMTYCCGRAR